MNHHYRGDIMHLRQAIIEEQNKIDRRIQRIEKEIRNLPKGRLLIKRDRKYYKWFNSYRRKQTYIRKADKALAMELAKKNLYTMELKNLKKRRTATKLFLNHYVDEGQEIYALLEKNGGYKELLFPQFMPTDQKILAWVNEPYESTAPYPEKKKHKTIDGNLVRSKSESIIVSALVKYGIPYRYEPNLQLGDVTYYPDFVIMHPRTGKLFYIEHFGMIDDPHYNRSMYDKLQTYNRHGIYQDINLITFFETRDHPLDPLTVDRKIKEFLENNI